MSNPTNDDSSERKLFRSSVIASVVASVIVIVLIQPFLLLLWGFLSSTGNDFLGWFVDRLYQNAALGNRNWIIALFAIIVLYVPFTNVIVLAIARPLIRRASAQKKQDEKQGSLVGRTTTLIATSATGLVCATIIASYIYVDLQLNASFDQRLCALAPHLTDQQEEQLKASWAMMISKADYLKIKENMELYASQANVKLPDPLLTD